jgi:hypothetical protein
VNPRLPAARNEAARACERGLEGRSFQTAACKQSFKASNLQRTR